MKRVAKKVQSKSQPSTPKRQSFLSNTCKLQDMSPSIVQLVARSPSSFVHLRASSLKFDTSSSFSVHLKLSPAGKLMRADAKSLTYLKPIRAPASILEVRDLVDQFLGSAASSIEHKNEHALVCVARGEVIGAIVLEALQDTPCYTLAGARATPRVVGVDRVWVHPSHRRRGLGRLLLVEGTRYCSRHVMNATVRPDMIAFSQPTDDGQALMAECCGEVVHYSG